MIDDEQANAAASGADLETIRRLGRPTAYKPEYARQAQKLCELGATDFDLAGFFEVSDRTIRTWRLKHADFAASCKTGKDAADDLVEQSLYRKATGYTFEAEKVFCQDGRVTRVAITEHMAPSDTAAIFWLKNRRGWRDKVDHEHTGKDGGDIVAKVTVDGVLARLATLDDEC